MDKKLQDQLDKMSYGVITLCHHKLNNPTPASRINEVTSWVAIDNVCHWRPVKV